MFAQDKHSSLICLIISFSKKSLITLTTGVSLKKTFFFVTDDKAKFFQTSWVFVNKAKDLYYKTLQICNEQIL